MLESTRRVDTVVLDKTGTVTDRPMSLVDVVAADGVDRDEVLRLAGALEHASEHPIARAIAARRRRASARCRRSRRSRNRDGLGVEGVVDGHAVVVGRPALLAGVGDSSCRPNCAQRASAARGTGRPRRRRLGRQRPRRARRRRHGQAHQRRRPIAELRGLGLRPVLLTGDNEPRRRAPSPPRSASTT